MVVVMALVMPIVVRLLFGFDRVTLHLKGFLFVMMFAVFVHVALLVHVAVFTIFMHIVIAVFVHVSCIAVVVGLFLLLGSTSEGKK